MIYRNFFKDASPPPSSGRGPHRQPLSFLLPWEVVSKPDKTVIPGEPNHLGRDPESRKIAESQAVVDPGSPPASVFAKASPDRPRDLAGMTNCERVPWRERVRRGGLR